MTLSGCWRMGEKKNIKGGFIAGAQPEELIFIEIFCNFSYTHPHVYQGGKRDGMDIVL